jgi:hypothetical protein
VSGRGRSGEGAFDPSFGVIEKLLDSPMPKVTRHAGKRGGSDPLCGETNSYQQMTTKDLTTVDCDACCRKLARRKKAA